MPLKRKLAIILALATMAMVALAYAYEHWHSSQESSSDELLASLPSDASAVIFLDLNELRQSPFLAELYKWAPQPAADPDYAQFVQATGFNYERDLDRVGIAMLRRGTDLLAIAEGRFDRKKISAYAARSGKSENRNGRQAFSVGLSGSPRRISFVFLTSGRIALTNTPDVDPSLIHSADDADKRDWQERFRRLAGSPAFVVVRPEASAGSPVERGHGALESPELATLLNQLKWITLAGRPAGDRLRVVCEGESATEATARQLSGVLNGLLMLAQTGLSDRKMREQLKPEVREAYLDVLKSADVSRIDRGETKSVRLIFDLTPQFLEAARSGPSLVPAKPKNGVGKPTIRN